MRSEYIDIGRTDLASTTNRLQRYSTQSPDSFRSPSADRGYAEAITNAIFAEYMMGKLPKLYLDDRESLLI